MNDNIKNLKGSESRDVFKWAHKNKMNAPFYASDADLCLVCDKPRGVVAYLDYKTNGDSVTYSERILYDEWTVTKPVFIIQGNDPENGPFKIYQYVAGGTMEYICDATTWQDFEKWEASIRREYSNHSN